MVVWCPSMGPCACCKHPGWSISRYYYCFCHVCHYTCGQHRCQEGRGPLNVAGIGKAGSIASITRGKQSTTR